MSHARLGLQLPSLPPPRHPCLPPFQIALAVHVRPHQATHVQPYGECGMRRDAKGKRAGGTQMRADGRHGRGRCGTTRR
ncbi:hypothetical protein DUNSADRAFT_9817, partial [Dunaliella salina]